jgi:hypothetical protein
MLTTTVAHDLDGSSRQRIGRTSRHFGILLTLVALGGLLLASSAGAAINLKINFQPSTSGAPAGYIADTGAAYTAVRGYGWVTQASAASATPLPLSISGGNMRARSAGPIPGRTFASMQYPNNTVTGVERTPAAWQADVPNGTYNVTVGVGDNDYYDSTHVIRLEGQTAIPAFTPTSANRFATATTTVSVVDGELTVDAVGGTNTKIDFVTIATAVDPTPPDAVTGLTTTPGNGQVKLTWTAATASDLAGYDIFRSRTSPVAQVGTPLNGATPLGKNTTTFTDTTALNGQQYYYLVRSIDVDGNTAAPAEVSGTPNGPLSALSAKFDFLPLGITPPAGYTADTGTAYDPTHGYGWVTQDSLSSSVHAPLDITPNLRSRTGGSDLDKSFASMQYPVNSSTGVVRTPAAWEADVPNGTYTVHVDVGDNDFYDSTHQIQVEGQTVISAFVPTSSMRFSSGVGTVVVSDGKLTVDAIGGTNTKLDYVTIDAATDTTPPAAPTNFFQTSDDGSVRLDWTASTSADVAGYDVFRSTTLPVPSSATDTPVNGVTPVTGTTFTDSTVFNGTTYYYVVRAEDTSGNSSVTAPVTASPTGAAPVLNYQFNFQPSDVAAPSGFTVDSGLAFSSTRGFGWVRQDSLSSSTHVPLDISSNTRKRNAVADPRLDSIIHMQFPAGKPGGNPTPAAWEAVVPNGSYDVQVGVGDPGYYDSKHTIHIEGQVAISNFVPSTSVPFKTITKTVNVADGLLTIDAIGGTNTKLDYVTIQTAPAGARPSIRSIAPADGGTGVNRSTSVTADLNLPNVGAGVDTATLTPANLRLVRASDGTIVPANANTSGGGDVLVLQPTAPLAANTQYRFEVTNGVKDLTGAPFRPTTSTFTTGSIVGSGDSSPAKFDQVALPTAVGKNFSSLMVGPDGKLYAATLDGDIARFPINGDGTLGAMETISSLTTAEGNPRMITGLAFDPSSTASNLILWVSHNYLAYAGGPDWSGAIARMSGPQLATVQDEIVGLPRSVRDHETNSLAFGPDGALYVTQGSDSSSGASDDVWGDRSEHLLTAAMLRIDTTKLSAVPLPLNVQTEGLSTNYNPYAANAPLTIYADGIRNAFDLVFHSNGHLYAPTNGAAAGGNTPATPSTLPASCANRIDAATNGTYTGPSVPGLTNVATSADDFLFDIVKGGYYGHPNASRCEWVANGGNPTSGVDPGQVPEYPVGTQPDRNWRGAAYDFGLHYSPDGAIEYHGSAFGGALDHALLVTRYSSGDDIIALTPGASGAIVNAETGITGFTGFNDPLDITEDQSNGNLYVSQLGDQTIVLLRPVNTTGSPAIKADAGQYYFNAATGGTPDTRNVTITNPGRGPLRISDISMSGANASEFALGSGAPTLPASIPPGNSLVFPITFTPSAAGVRTATATFSSNDPSTPALALTLRGLGTTGAGPAGEPSLQRVLDTYNIPINVGDPNPNTADLPGTSPLGDELAYGQRMRKVDADTAVSVEPIAVFGPDGPVSTAVSLGWNRAGLTTQNTSLFSVANTSDQALAPTTTGSRTFDPGNVSFGLYTTWPGVDGGRAVYTEDALNTFDSTMQHHARWYPLKSSGGVVVPNAYVVAFEEITASYDFQDVVAIVRNVEPAPTNARIAVTNQDAQPFNDRLVFNRIGSLAAPPSNIVHDRSTAVIANTGTDPLKITDLNLTGPFQLVSPPTLPLNLDPGTSVNVTVKFVATSGSVVNGTLSAVSTDPDHSTLPIQLSGFWQSVSEGGVEPTLSQIVSVMGYTTAITNSGQSINQHGLIAPVGDEVLSPYWQRLDTTKSVSVSQLASFHTQGNTAALYYYQRGGSLSKSLLVSAGAEGQSMLPHKNGSPTVLANTTFTPPAEFGFRVDGEYSDDAKNAVTADQTNGCPGPCGHHMRFFPVKDRSGAPVTGAYLMVMDYSGINYDYQDNIYLVTNIRPDQDGSVIARIDAGGAAPYTDTRGRTWQPDTGLFSPSTTPAEGGATAPLAITDTSDSSIYDTYRSNVGAVPQAQRILDYAIPVPDATAVDVRLHFAERYAPDAANGARVFDVFAEGNKVIGAMDIFRSAGAINTAYVKAINNIPVTDGVLNLSFRATADYPSVAGIEVLCASGCPSG